VAAFAIETNLSFTRLFRTRLSWVTSFLASVTAGTSLFSAALPTTFIHELFFIYEALARWMADLLTVVTAFKS
jgi:hypothetical protein